MLFYCTLSYLVLRFIVYFESRVLQNYLRTYAQNAGNRISEVWDFKKEPPREIVCTKSSYVSTLFIQLQLMIHLRKIWLEKYFAPFNSKLISSTVEIGRRTLFIASLASLVSTQILIPPSFLGTAKIGDTYGVGWSSGTRLIISSLSNSSNLHFTFSRMWYGICCCGCTLGVWSLSMFSFTFSPFNFHRPWNTCLLKILSSLLSLISDTLLMCKLIRPNYHFHLFSWHKMLPRQFISRFR